MTTPSQSIKLFGTDAPVEPIRELNAGPLSAQLDGGALRYIRVYGVEAIRHVEFVVRDKDWGTYQPDISNLKVEASSDGFTVSYDAVCKDAKQEFHYSAHIRGKTDGTLVFTGTGRAITDFLTNRTGFVVLHPVAGVSGFPVTVEHVDGRTMESEFPELVDPIQPFKDIRALTHEVVPGVKVSCRMDGDTFEMEDHRQWNDASYKTYVRPIALPWPYVVPAGDVLEQSVTLNLQGVPVDTKERTGAVAGADSGNSTVLTIGTEPDGLMPRIGLGLEPQHCAAALERAALVRQLGVQQIVCWHDLRAGHGVQELSQARALCETIGAEAVLEAVIPADDYQIEIDKLADQAKQAGITFSAVTVAPAAYLQSIMPGTVWPEVPALADIYDAASAAFPGSVIGGGMHAFFPELNRHRPPTGHLDYVTHCSNTITHACDDITVTENLEALPYIIKTCHSFADGKPYRVGPSAIAMRFNPYGSKTMDNPENRRVAMARMDPRQRGLINAAWTIGYAAHTARGGIEVITLQAPVGEFGLIYHRMDWPQPWFDAADARVYPAYHAVAGLASGAGAPQLPVTSSNSHDIEAVAWRAGDRVHVWVANLTAQERKVELRGLSAARGTVATLDSSTFEHCVMDADGFCKTSKDHALDKLTLGAYAVCCLTA